MIDILSGFQLARGRRQFRILDWALRTAVVRAAAPSELRFTERQLYYELCRVLRPWHLLSRRLPFTVAPPVSYRDFRAALRRYGNVPGLLPPQPPPSGRPGRHTTEPDLFDYGLPRILVCEPSGIANMLHANGLPMESACPVFDAAEPLDPGVARMLTHAEGTIYLLHDATPSGLGFPQRFREHTDVPPGVRVVPLGLRLGQAAPLHLTHGRGPGGRFVEVAAVRPASLLRTMHSLVREVRPNRPQWSIGRDVGFLTWPAV
jgi:hypothetical protein